MDHLKLIKFKNHLTRYNMTHQKTHCVAKQMCAPNIALNPWSFYSLLISNSQDCHTRAWECVSEYIDANLKIYSSKMMEAEPVLMPAVRSWIRSQAVEHGNSPEDHGVIMIMNCPTAGILSGLHKSFITNFITNVLADFPLNGLCILVHSNRASQNEGRTNQGLVTFCYLINNNLEENST